MGSKSTKPIILRADGNAKIGHGHVMRLLALGQAWQELNGVAYFVVSHSSHELQARLSKDNIESVSIDADPGSAMDAHSTVVLADELGAAWVVTDGYRFNENYQSAVKEAGLHLLAVDDNAHCNHYYADLILNQNVHANDSLYAKRENYTKLLLGTQYALIRREFQEWRSRQRSVPAVAKKILISLGGADPDNVTLKVVNALRMLDSSNVDPIILVGSSNPNMSSIRNAVVGSNIKVLTDASNMPELMAWADIAISAGGTTSWELAFMGLPTIMIVIAENQQSTAQKLGELDSVINLGWYDNVTVDDIIRSVQFLIGAQEIRLKMATIGRQIVDGKGPLRILKAMGQASIRLRRVTEADCKLIWEWANDPDTRDASFSTNYIPWENHVSWFFSKIQSADSILYISEDEHGSPIGQVRFDLLGGNEAVISISIDCNARGQGYGTAIIEAGCAAIEKVVEVSTVHAYIKPSNSASIKAFTKAGFVKTVDCVVNNQNAIHMIRRVKTYD